MTCDKTWGRILSWLVASHNVIKHIYHVNNCKKCWMFFLAKVFFQFCFVFSGEILKLFSAGVHWSVSHSLNEASNSLQCAAAKLQTQHCCTSTRSTYVYRDWFSFGWPLGRCQVTLVHRDIQVAARSVGCIGCVRDLDIGMWKRADQSAQKQYR